MCLFRYRSKWIDNLEFQKADCVQCIIDYSELYPFIKNNSSVIEQMDECREKMLIECDPPEFDDCIRLDRKCYNVARELDEQKKLTKAKSSLLAQRKREHMMVKMFGQGYWRKK